MEIGSAELIVFCHSERALDRKMQPAQTNEKALMAVFRDRVRELPHHPRESRQLGVHKPLGEAIPIIRFLLEGLCDASVDEIMHPFPGFLQTGGHRIEPGLRGTSRF